MFKACAKWSALDEKGEIRVRKGFFKSALPSSALPSVVLPIVLALLGLCLGSPVTAFARNSGGDAAQANAALQGTALPSVALNALPRQALATYQLIRQGGPFPQEKDGVVFFNRERILPQRARGYYHEYTVATPGVSGRGGKRIVCGGNRVAPEVCFYTADHYASFRMIAP